MSERLAPEPPLAAKTKLPIYFGLLFSLSGSGKVANVFSVNGKRRIPHPILPL